MAVDTGENETPEQRLAAAEAADAKSEAELMKDVEGVLSKDTNQADSAGDEKDAPDEVKEKTGEDAKEKAPEPLDAATLAHAQSIGLDEATATQFHKAGLLEETLAAADRRVLTGNTGQRRPEDRAGQNVAPEGAPPPLDPEEYPEELVARDRFMQNTIASLQQQLQQVGGIAQGFQAQREKAREEWLDSQFDKLGQPEVFGKGPMRAIKPDSPEAKARMVLVQAYHRLTGDAFANDEAGFQRGHRALFHDEIKRAEQKKVADKLRDAAGQFVSPSKGGKSPDPPPAKTEEEAEANMMADVDKVLARHGK